MWIQETDQEIKQMTIQEIKEKENIHITVYIDMKIELDILRINYSAFVTANIHWQ
jgi:hypothetical protein